MRRLPPTVHDDVVLVPKNVTGERCIALLITMVRWWEWLRAPEVVKWQQRHHVRWDAADNRNGGAERTVWETLLEMERFEQHTGEKGQGAFALVLDLAKAFERVCVPVVWAWATHFRFPKNFLRVPCGYFQHQRRVQLDGCMAEPLHTVTAIFSGSKMELLALSHCVAKRNGEVMKVNPPVKVKVFVDDITAFMERRNKELAGATGGVLPESYSNWDCKETAEIVNR